jgi:hypothetical protein
VAYILCPGDSGYVDGRIHGLIATLSDQSKGIQWFNKRTTTTGATATALGTGRANTNAIIASHGIGSYPASLCKNLTLGGFSDWYLPSKDELNQLYINRETIGGFASANYWSSSEFNNYFAWTQSFGDGSQDAFSKYNTYCVRAVRAF